MQTTISRSALAELMQDAGFSYKMLHKAAAERDEAMWIEFRDWAYDYMTADMSLLTSPARTPVRSFVSGSIDEGNLCGYTHTRFKKGEHYSILAAIGVNGHVATRIVVGSVDSREFFDFIVSDDWYVHGVQICLYVPNSPDSSPP